MIKDRLVQPVRSFVSWIKQLNGAMHYKLAERRNHYACKAVGQKTTKPGHTIILYTLLGKRDVYEIPIQDLLNNNELINRFPPTQAIKFGVIALGDLSFGIPYEQQQQRFETIKNQILT